MKILKKGKEYDPNWKIKVACEDCGCVFEATKNDLEKVHLGEEGMSVGFRCPTPDCYNFIEAPGWVRPFEEK